MPARTPEIVPGLVIGWQILAASLAGLLESC